MKYFQSQIVFSKPDKINRESGILEGVSICRIGEARGHDLWINERFINDVVKLGNAKPGGVKSRFGHPNMCADALGTFLGRYKNFRVEGDQAKADLNLDPSAKKTPNGDLFNYVIDLAENNPDMFGNSIVFAWTESEKIECEIEGSDDGKGNPLKEMRRFPIIDELAASDLVDDPAATDGLFSSIHFTDDSFAAKVSEFLDLNPEIYGLIYKKPEVLKNFLTNYASYKKQAKLSSPQKPDRFMKIKEAWTAIISFFGNAKKELDEADVDKLNSELSNRQVKIDDLTASNASLTSSVSQKDTEIAALKQSISEKDAEISTLKQGKAGEKKPPVVTNDEGNKPENSFSESSKKAQQLFNYLK